MPFSEVVVPEIFRQPGTPSSVATRSESGPLLHIAGQTPRDESGKTVGIGDITAQTHQVMRRLKWIVEAEGGSLSDICRLMIYITHPQHLAKTMEVRKQYFSEPYPATTAVITQLANPEWLIEVDGTAALPR